MSDTQTIQTDDGAIAGDPNSNQQEENENSTKQPEESEEATGQPDDSTDETDYKRKFVNSSKEAIRLKREAEKAKQEVAYARKLALVAKEPDKLDDISLEDPDLADKLSQELYGKTYAEFSNTDAKEKSVEDVTRKVLQKEKEREEREKIDEFEIEFLVKRGLTPGDSKANKVLDTYEKFKPKTLKEAKTLMEMAYAYHFPSEKYEPEKAGIAPTSVSSAPSGGKYDAREHDEYNKALAQYGARAISKDAFIKAKQQGIL